MRQAYLGIILIVGLLGLLARPANAATYWIEDFDGGTPYAQPGAWGDETDDSGYNAEIAYSCTDSLTVVTRTADDTWGKVMSPTEAINVADYPMVEITVAACSSSVSWKIGIQEAEGSYAYANLNSSSSATGTFSYNFATAMGWSSGTHNFKVVVIVEGGAGEYVVIDSVRIYGTSTVATLTPSPTPTVSPTPDNSTPTSSPTITPTAVITDYWMDHFSGTAGQQPTNWEDATDSSTYNAEIAYDSADSLASVSRTANSATWGKVLSPVLYCNTQFYPRVAIRVAGLYNGARWKVGIQESGGNYLYYDLSSENSSAGTYEFDYNAATGWNDTHAFQVQIIVAGDANAYALVDYVKVYAVSPVPTATPTPPAYVAWSCPMDGAAGSKPDNWTDERDDRGKNLYVFYATAGQCLGLTRSAEAKYGTVSSPQIHADVSSYPLLQVSVKSVTAKAKWRIGIQETTNDKCYADLCVSSGLTGTFTWDYPAAMAANNLLAWSGERDFNVVLIVEGAAGSRVEIDNLRIFGYNLVNTVTPTITPWLSGQNVVAYPNPSRDRVTFAYCAVGGVNVRLDVYKMTGQRVASVTESKTGRQGEVLETVWNAVAAPPGIYFCHLTVTGVNGGTWADVTKKIAIAK